MTRDRQPAAAAADLDWAVRVQRLESEVAGLRRAMASRGVIEQAKGVLAERLGCSPDEAFAHLSTMSQRSNVRLADVAASLLASMTGGTGADAAAEERGGIGEPRDRDATPVPSGGPAGAATTRRETLDSTDPDASAFALPLDFAPIYRDLAAHAAACKDLSEFADVMLGAGLEPEVAAVYDVGDLAEPRGFAIAERETAAGYEAAARKSGAFATLRPDRETNDAMVSAAAEAVTTDRPVWRHGGKPLVRIAAFPLPGVDSVLGAVVLGWWAGRPDPGPWRAEERRYLGALVPVAQRAASRLWGAPSHPVASVLDTGYDPGLLLEPVRDDGQIVDFVIEYASVDVPDMAGLSRAEQIGRRLLDTYPHLGKSGVFHAYLRVLETGEPWVRGAQQETVVVDGAPTIITVARRAIRYGRGLLVTWHRDDDRVRRERQLQRMEALGHFGWADWDLAGRQTYWSPGMFRIFDRDPARGPMPFTTLADAVGDSEQDAVTAMVNAVNRGQAAGAEFRLAHDSSERHVRIIAEPLPAGDGRVIGVLAVAQDLTETRVADERMLRVQAQLAEQRLNLAAQREVTRELRRVLYPGLVCDVSAPGGRITGRHAAPDDDRYLRGDFCDATLLDDGHILFAIGDSFGSGVRAGEVLARLLYPARALGNAGVPPAEVLRILNKDFDRDEVPPLASMVVGRYCPTRRAVTWAQAGHLPPVRLLEQGTRMLERPAGPILGLMPAPDFAQSHTPIRDGDMIVWMTDGMVFDRDRPDSDPWPNLRRSLAAARRADGLDGVLSLCHSAAADDEACMLVLTAISGQVAGARDASCQSAGCAPSSELPASAESVDS